MKRVGIIIFIVAFFFFPDNVLAESREEILKSCIPILGGGSTSCQQSNNITLNKKLLSPDRLLRSEDPLPEDSSLVENVTSDEYAPNQLIVVRLFVTNTSNRELKDIKVEDFLPLQYINFVKSDGQYDSKTKTVKATIQSLKPKETKTLNILLQTAQADQLPQGVNFICVVNQARVSVGREQSQDNAQLCIQPQKTAPFTSTPTPQPLTTKGGMPLYTPPQAQKTPSTGASLITLISLMTSTLAGFVLRKKVK